MKWCHQGLPAALDLGHNHKSATYNFQVNLHMQSMNLIAPVMAASKIKIRFQCNPLRGLIVRKRLYEEIQLFIPSRNTLFYLLHIL